MAKLTAKQQRFVDEYILDCNATQAAVRAGFSKKTAEKQGWQLLQKPQVAEAIKERRAKVSDKAEIDAVWIRQKLVRVVNLSLTIKPRLVKMHDEFSGRRVKRTVRTYDASAAINALKLLGQDKGMFKTQIDLSGTLSAPALDAVMKELPNALRALGCEKQAEALEEIS
jgi:phage terminase small subunit